MSIGTSKYSKAYRIKIRLMRKNDEGFEVVDKLSPVFFSKEEVINWYRRYLKNKEGEITVLRATILEGLINEVKPGHYIFKELRSKRRLR